MYIIILRATTKKDTRWSIQKQYKGIKMELYKTRSSNAQKCKKRRNTGMGKRGDNKNFKKEKIG